MGWDLGGISSDTSQTGASCLGTWDPSYDTCRWVFPCEDMRGVALSPHLRHPVRLLMAASFI